jgi:hypothetical protein
MPTTTYTFTALFMGATVVFSTVAGSYEEARAKAQGWARTNGLTDLHVGRYTRVGVRRARGIRTSQVRVSTSGYQFAHGRMPRGTGGWIFEHADNGTAGQQIDQFSAHGTYSACKRQAVQWAAANGYYSITVAS